MIRTYISTVLLVLALAVCSAGLSFAADAPKGAAPNDDPWFQRCNKGAEGSPKRGRCEVFQRLVHNESGARIVELAIGFPDDKEIARGIISLPLGILVQKNMQMSIDNNPPFSFKVRYCDTNGCYAFLNLDKTVLDLLSKGTKTTITFQSMKPQNVQIELSLKGFAKALKGIS